MSNPQDSYEAHAVTFAQLGLKTEVLIRDLLKIKGIDVLDVVHRVKSEASARKKIASKHGTYSSFDDLHDMLGVRIITYLASDVGEVVEVLRQNFLVDDDRSSDKQRDLDPDRFGYLSHHLIAQVHPSRERLAEWLPFGALSFEIQVRSILQHAWAEIEHDLGYKSASGVPAHIRRRFARLAGLLELADVEFDGVSSQVADHVARVESVLAVGGDLAIDRDSIRALATSAGPVSQADRAIASGIGATVDETMSLRYSDARAAELLEVGYKSVDEVRTAIAENLESIVRFAVAWFERPERPEVDLDSYPEDVDSDGRYVKLSPGICLFYLYLHRRLETPFGERLLTNIRGMDLEQEQDAFRRIHDEAFVS